MQVLEFIATQHSIHESDRIHYEESTTVAVAPHLEEVPAVPSPPRPR
jgi:hypothetical protein